MAAKERPVTRPVSGLDIASKPYSRRIGVQTVTLLQVMDVDFTRHIEHVYATIESIVSAQGGRFELTLPTDDPTLDVESRTIANLTRMFVTALHTRVQHTRLKNSFRKQADFIHPRAMESTPTQFAYVANAVGVIKRPDGGKVVPELSAEALAMVLTQEEWQALAVRLRGYEPLGVRLVHALETREYGDDKVMVITPIVEITGDIVYTSHEPVAGTQYLTASTLGIKAKEAPLELPMLDWYPAYTVESFRLVTFYPEFARVSEAL